MVKRGAEASELKWKGKAVLLDKPRPVVQAGPPVLNGGKMTLSAWLKRFSFFKPGNRLGGGWMADRVAQRRPINLCPSCVNKYKNWHLGVNYMADWDCPEWITDCDGCGDHMAFHCVGFYPEETALKVMTKENHFRKPNPHKRLLFGRWRN